MLRGRVRRQWGACRECASLARPKTASGYACFKTPALIVLVFGSFRWCGFVSKFTMTNSSTSVADINPAPQGDRAEQNHRHSERQRGLVPFDWRGEGNCAHSDQRVESPD